MILLLFLLDGSPVISLLSVIAPPLVENWLSMREVYSARQRGCQEEGINVTHVTFGTLGNVGPAHCNVTRKMPLSVSGSSQRLVKRRKVASKRDMSFQDEEV